MNGLAEEDPDRKGSLARFRSLSESDLGKTLDNLLGDSQHYDGQTIDKLPDAIVVPQNDFATSFVSDFKVDDTFGGAGGGGANKEDDDDDAAGESDDEFFTEEDGFGFEEDFGNGLSSLNKTNGTRSSISRIRELNQNKLRDSLYRLGRYDDASSEATQRLREFLQHTLLDDFAGGGSDRKLRGPRPFGGHAVPGSDLSTMSSVMGTGSADMPPMTTLRKARTGPIFPTHHHVHNAHKKRFIGDLMGGDNKSDSNDVMSLPDDFEAVRQALVPIQREQLIDSIAWFSFHTPRCVLEDLTLYELHPENESTSLIPTARRRRSLIDDDDDEDDSGTVSSLSDDSESLDSNGHNNSGFGQKSLKGRNHVELSTLALPYFVKRESALVFVDISGFTKLSRMLDVESLSKVINSYFRMMVDEVVKYGGDILKFAGDAFFAEWRVSTKENAKRVMNHPLSNLRASFFSAAGKNEPLCVEARSLTECVEAASLCASSMVKLYSDFKVAAKSHQLSISFGVEQQGKIDAMLNVHCGVGVGTLVGLHVGDVLQRHDDMVENRREFLFLGDPIDQVSKAAEAAQDGEVLASPEAISILKATCRLPQEVLEATGPVCIAARESSLVHPRIKPRASAGTLMSKQSLPPSVMAQYVDLDQTSLVRLHRQLSLYVHPVVRGDELDSSTSDNGATVIRSRDASVRKLRAEAELRLVYTMFIKAVMSPKICGIDELDKKLYAKLQSIMNVTSRELQKFSGHLRQFIVDDKGVVLIGTFGLRGSTFANMVAHHALPATFAIHTALKTELGVENRIGATFGKVYCGVVGGIRRHEFAVMGAPVNLAARLMYSPQNRGILVDEAVQANADSRFAFKSLPPVNAKGYDKPVIIFEPLHAVTSKKRGVSHGFIGRAQDVKDLTDVAKSIMDGPQAKTIMAFIIGEAGMGKTALGLCISDEMKKYAALHKKRFIFSRSTSTETEQRIPLSSFRKIFLGAIREMCIWDGTLSVDDGRMGAIGQPTRRLIRTSPRRGSFGKVARSRRLTVPRQMRRATSMKLNRMDSMASLASIRSSQNVPYLKKLCEVCEHINYPYEYADIVGSQLLGLESANPITHVEGHVPTIDEVVEFLTKAFIQVTQFSDLTIIFLDDFQWIDSLTWKVIRLLCQKGRNTLLMGAMRSQETQALRRMSSVASWHGQMQSRIVEVSLGPLELSEVKELISKVLDCDVHIIDESFCNDIYQRTGGLPIYVVELLENVKRNKNVAIDEFGMLKWTPDAEREHQRIGPNSVAAIELSFLNRFDSLDKTVRQVLQTCAVLGMSFALSDVIRVHKIEEHIIEHALNAAVDELILVEDIEDEDEDEDESMWSGSDSRVEPRTATTVHASDGDRFFQFSHAMWRKSVLDKMLKEQKINLHRSIAEAMENEQVLNMESSDIGRLLTLFDHWKSCGNFGKAAPLALAVGLRLEDWDLSAQSLDLYRDALEMCYESADNSDGREPSRDEKELWLPASAPPATVEFILRLHIRIAKCHAHLGEQEQCATTFEDAYKIMTTSPKAARLNQELVLPIISGLCSIAIQRSASDNEALLQQEELVERFVSEARERADDTHICRALSMKASYYARLGTFRRAIESQLELQGIYDVEVHSSGIREEYGKDYAAQCIADCVQWYSLVDDTGMAEEQTNMVISTLVPNFDLRDVDAIMEIIFPVLMVMKSMGRTQDAETLLFNNAINPYHDLNGTSSFGFKLFNPLAYLLDVIKMDEDGTYDQQLLTEIEDWVLDTENTIFHPNWERKGFILIGEICWRLVRFKAERDEVFDDLMEQGRRVLMRVVYGRDEDQSDTFLFTSAREMLDALDEIEDDDDEDDDGFFVDRGHYDEEDFMGVNQEQQPLHHGNFYSFPNGNSGGLDSLAPSYLPSSPPVVVSVPTESTRSDPGVSLLHPQESPQTDKLEPSNDTVPIRSSSLPPPVPIRNDSGARRRSSDRGKASITSLTTQQIPDNGLRPDGIADANCRCSIQ